MEHLSIGLLMAPKRYSNRIVRVTQAIKSEIKGAHQAAQVYFERNYAWLQIFAWSITQNWPR
jgi:hypothetical protein